MGDRDDDLHAPLFPIHHIAEFNPELALGAVQLFRTHSYYITKTSYPLDDGPGFSLSPALTFMII